MTAQASLRILIADDHAIVRQGLKLLIDSQPDMQVVGEAPDGKTAIDLAAALKPDIVVLDISMPGMSGLTATRTLKERKPELTIVALTRHEDETYLEELIRAGASAYVLKQSDPADFLRAIRAVAAGGIYLDPAMTSRVADGLFSGKERVDTPPPTTLTARETEVLRLVAVGHGNSEIAARLDISVKTVELHKSNAIGST
jgi:DNA-binding NarL/FixJ family response regulator